MTAILLTSQHWRPGQIPRGERTRTRAGKERAGTHSSAIGTVAGHVAVPVLAAAAGALGATLLRTWTTPDKLDALSQEVKSWRNKTEQPSKEVHNLGRQTDVRMDMLRQQATL